MAGAISLMLIILFLVLQYNALGKPLIIMLTIPLTLIGAFLGLFATGNSFGFMPQLGLLSLFGVVVNAAIIFIDFAQRILQQRAESATGNGPYAGLARDELYAGLAEAGRVRLLPIFLTTSTTVAGLFPLALKGGPLWEGMAWLMIFGLTVATLLTLLVVPVLYAAFVEYLGMKPFPVEQPPAPDASAAPSAA